MKINLVELDHQKDAMDALLSAMPDVIDKKGIYSNPLLENAYDEKHFIDIKMETGTGKTYVYTRTMFELNKQGLFKFIIVVPSLAIKEGTKNFILSDYAKQHFSRPFPNKRIDLQLINAGDFSTKKGRRKNFPASIMQFCNSTVNENNTIQCLLISDKGFLDKKTSALFKDDYDQSLNGFSCPIDAIKSTRPVVIIDEPHRFKKDGETYKNIIEKINPQLIIRFGATFPKITVGRGANRVEKIDYYQNQPQYNLGAVEAFNKDLVKGVSIQFPYISDEELNVYKVKSVTRNELLLTKDGKDCPVILAGEDLSDVGGGFDGDVTYAGNGKLSNELELSAGMELCEGIYTNSYQELLIQQAINAHFKSETENFFREGYKVKTNTLFFIDSVNSYRDDDGWLKLTFEKLLKNKLDELLKEYPSGEYHDFLQATRNDIKMSHGGYFAKDWGESDESAIREEVEDILHKERTLPFKNENGKWNIRRFFFSKWTLREGWDNPNVFTICKLRSSGSENSKIQEVGRGLRLPVDEMGNRLSGNNWILNFIVGWNEREFAQKLVGDINRDATIKLDTVHLSDDMIKIVCEKRNVDKEEFLENLFNEGIIKFSHDFKEGGFDKLLELYPELTQSILKRGKVTAPDLPKRPKIKLKKENWNKIKDLWLKISKRYMVFLERLDKDTIKSLFKDVLNKDDVFEENKNIKIVVHKTVTSDNEVSLSNKYESVENVSGMGKLPYNEFVIKLAKQTKIPIQIIHECMWEKLSQFSDLSKEEIKACLNNKTLQNISKKWEEKFEETFATKYNYDSLNFKVDTSVLKGENFEDELEQGLVGNMLANDVELDNRNLYEKPTAYDSEDPEHEIEKINPPSKIKVFGKIPRRSIKVPTYTGGSTSPDFIFATEKDGKTDLTLLIETKAKSIRMSEKIAIEAQEKLFKNIPNVHWELIKNADDVRCLLEKF